VAAGAEGEAGIQIEGGAAGGHGGLALPVGDDVELFSHRDGLVILLPAGGPVVFLKGLGGVGGVDAGEPGVPLAIAVGVVGDVEGHLAQALHAVFQVAVHVVPILPVFRQEAAEVGLILDLQAGGAVHGELGAEGVQVRGGGGDVDGQPGPVRHYRSFPRKKRATQPTPVWEPMTGPMKL